MNWGPQSETSLVGVPCRFQTWCRSSSAVSSAGICDIVGMKRAIFYRWSTTTRRSSILSSLGRLVMKSRLTHDQTFLGMGRGCMSRRAVDHWDFVVAQI